MRFYVQQKACTWRAQRGFPPVSHIFTHPSTGCRAIARGFSRFCHKSTFLWVPSKFATSIRDVPESVQYNLSWIQSIASPPMYKTELSTEWNHVYAQKNSSLSLFTSEEAQFLLLPVKINSRGTLTLHPFHPTHSLPQEDALCSECWVPTFLHSPTLYHCLFCSDAPGLSSPVETTSSTLLPFRLALMMRSSVTSDQNTSSLLWWKSRAMAFSRLFRSSVYSERWGNTCRISIRLAKSSTGSGPRNIQEDSIGVFDSIWLGPAYHSLCTKFQNRVLQYWQQKSTLKCKTLQRVLLHPLYIVLTQRWAVLNLLANINSARRNHSRSYLSLPPLSLWNYITRQPLGSCTRVSFSYMHFLAMQTHMLYYTFYYRQDTVEICLSPI